MAINNYNFTDVASALLQYGSQFESLLRSLGFLPAKSEVVSIDHLASHFVQDSLHTLPMPVQLYGFGKELKTTTWGVFGAESSSADVYLLYLAIKTAEKLLKSPVIIRIGLVGCPDCRPKFLRNLSTFLNQRRSELCADCRGLNKDRLQSTFDCSKEKCLAARKGMPTLLDADCNHCNRSLREILESLEGLSLPYELIPHMSQGHLHHSNFRYTLHSQKLPQLVGQGGRSRSLTRSVGGPEFDLAYASLELAQLAKKSSNARLLSKTTVYVIQIGERSRTPSFEILSELSRSGINAYFAPDRTSIKTQLRLAEKVGCNLMVIIGEKEAIDGSVIIRETASGAQDTLDRAQLLPYLKTHLH